MFAALMNFVKTRKLLPRISDTERQALEAGQVWIDGEIFGGNPDFQKMLAENYNKLAVEEQAFLDGPTEEVCRMIDRYEITRTRRAPEPVLAYLKKQGFFGLLIPKEYGGKGFSTLLRSCVMAKLSPVSTIINTYVLIPNSLGAAELILHYGTDAQKQHYLPRLASGEFIPCFGLTEPTAGSDAASIKAEGHVFKGVDGRSQIKLNFRKRFITLAPVSNLISIACQLHDPANLLGKGVHPGITVVLVHKGTPGLQIGDHHEPIGDPFPNGPIIGRDVVVPVDSIVGGPAYAGQGWRMLMEQLAGGRAISLPAGAIGEMKRVMAVTGAYSMVRQQFGIPIGRMEGVEDKVGKIAALTYAFEGARVFSCSAIDSGQQPPVVSAVLKAYSTEVARELVRDGMDIFAGSGVMQGPNNIMGTGYASSPVGITVEGANIMTRTLIIFGQGATRCHPYALNLVKAIEKDDAIAFRDNLLGWFGHFFASIGRSLVRTLTRGFTFRSPVSGETATFYRRLGWASARFAMLTDLALFFIGGKLKSRGKLAGRYADALAWQFVAFSSLRRFEAEGRIAEDLPLVRYACEYALRRIQEAFEGIYANFDAPLVGWWMRTVGSWILRVNPLARPMS
ncbi:MAG TPA: acyl-CoA dehydrogenase, partial [Burkholderiales bacterium]|nr:acyl-CoA dehydrogenase [Burkholderiales bacterium]